MGKNFFVEIALSCTVIEVTTFLPFAQKFKMAIKNGGKTIFGKICQQTLRRVCGSKISSKSLYLTRLSRYMRFCIFYAEIQDGCQKWWENNFWEKTLVDYIDTLRVKNFVEITLSCTVSETLKIFHFQHREKLWRLVNC